MGICISVKDLHKTFTSGFLRRRFPVLKGVTFDVNEGEIFGFLGPNGSGKTTTIKILLGLIFADSGRVELLGNPSERVDFKRMIGFLPDSPYFYQYLTGREFLIFYAQLFGFARKESEKRVAQFLDLVELAHAQKMPLRKYSRGMLQRLGMAQALINDPRLVIMDEPMEGLDPIGRKLFRDIILKLKSEGKTVFFSTHILSDVEMICDRVAIMVKGSIKDTGLLSELLKPKINCVEVCFRKASDRFVDELKRKTSTISMQGDEMMITLQENELPEFLKKAVEANVPILSVIPYKESLERIFMSEVL